MGFELISFSSGLVEKQAAQEIVRCNDYTEQFGLVLTQQQAAQLVQTRSDSLRQNGRIEFGGGVIDKIIREFCDSPYLCADNYAQTLQELIELFYAFKSACREQAADGELIEALRLLFDGPAQGCTELIAGLPWRTMLRIARTGTLAGTGLERFEEDDHGQEWE